MFARCAEIVTTYFVRKEIITKDDKEIYGYGFEILLSSVFSVALTIIIGFIANRLIDSLVFLVVYCSLRMEAGGFHASTHFRCILLFISVFVITMNVASNIVIVNMIIIAPLLLCCILLFCIFAPVENKEIKFQAELKRRLRLKANILLIMYILIFGFCLHFDLVNIRYVLIGIMAILWESILIILGVLQNIHLERLTIKSQV